LKENERWKIGRANIRKVDFGEISWKFIQFDAGDRTVTLRSSWKTSARTLGIPSSKFAEQNEGCSLQRKLRSPTRKRTVTGHGQ